MRCVAVLSVRNEGAFLLEWLDHHRAVGFTDFVVFSNDCQDGTDTMLDHLAEAGVLVHVRIDGPYHRQGIQFTALNRAAGIGAVRDADWILPLDIDEFVNIHVGAGRLPDLIDALPQATAITLTWRLFGNAGLATYADVPVTGRFTRCAPPEMYWPWRSAMFKTLYRNDGTYAAPGVHRPRRPDRSRLDAARWFDGEGRELDAQFRTRRIFSNFGRPNHALVQLNHYPLKDMQSFVLKADRGRAVHADQVLGLDYWVERNFNTHEDRTILEPPGPAGPGYATLTSDPRLRALHEAAVSWRHARFAALMEHEPFRALYGRLMMCPPSIPLASEQAQILLRYALGANRFTRN